MHKLRFKAYLILIQSLLHCHPDKHSEILLVNYDVLDPFLVHLMEQVAVTLAEQGNKSVAESLRIRAAQITLDISWKS